MTMCTDEEAKERPCPIRYATLEDPTPKKPSARIVGTCFGSLCMMWRWMPSETEPRQGFCGLAGGVGDMIFRRAN